MKLKILIILETLNNYEILSEDTVSSFIANCENRYINRFRNSRVKAAKILSTKSIKDKILCTDQSIGINKKEFRRLCILKFDSSKHKIPREDFIIILDNYLTNYTEQRLLIP